MAKPAKPKKGPSPRRQAVLGQLCELDDLSRLAADNAEIWILSVIMREPEFYERCSLGSQEFVIPGHRKIYEAMGELIQDGGTPELVALTNYFRQKGQLSNSDPTTDQWVTPAFLTDIATEATTTALFEEHCLIVHNHFLDRELITSCVGTIDEIIEHEKDRADIVAGLADKLAAISESRSDIQEVTASAFEGLEKEIVRREVCGDDVPMGFMTGVPPWDFRFGGIFEREMTVLASRPGVGKSSALEMALQSHLDHGEHVLLFQKDMSPVTQLGRMAARRARVQYERYIKGLMGTGELSDFRKAAAWLKSKSHLLHIYDPSRLTPSDLEATVRKEKREHKIKSWWLDHFFQLTMKSHGGEHLTEAAADASIILRRCIHQTGVPGIILVHTNRESLKSVRPNGSHLKYCDQLLGDCDRLIILWSDIDPISITKEHEKQEVTFTMDKNRCGRTGDFKMNFWRELMTFEEV